jgi:polyisoprenoid-binding protein YceI
MCRCKGRFKKFTAQIDFDPKKLASAKAQLEVDPRKR